MTGEREDKRAIDIYILEKHVCCWHKGHGNHFLTYVDVSFNVFFLNIPRPCFCVFWGGGGGGKLAGPGWLVALGTVYINRLGGFF